MNDDAFDDACDEVSKGFDKAVIEGLYFLALEPYAKKHQIPNAVFENAAKTLTQSMHEYLGEEIKEFIRNIHGN